MFRDKSRGEKKVKKQTKNRDRFGILCLIYLEAEFPVLLFVTKNKSQIKIKISHLATKNKNLLE